MAAFIIRKIDPDLWAKVKARADKEGHPIRWVLLQFLNAYANHKDTGRRDA